MKRIGLFSSWRSGSGSGRIPNWLQLSSNAFYGENMKGDWMIEIFDHLDEENNEDQEKRDWVEDDHDGENALIFEWKLKLYGHE
jgi:subtilisin-like proprotein convertase family protein